MSRFADKLAVVTGGASGIGASITRRLVADGAAVLVADINKNAIASATSTFGPTVTGLHVDAACEDDMTRLFTFAVEEFGGPDAVFNVAGGSRPGRIVDMDLAHWDYNIRLNLHSAFLGTKLGAEHFLDTQKPGSIVNIASVNSFMPMHWGSGYSTAKAGVVMLTKSAALELGEYGIRVNAVSPGAVNTPMTAALQRRPDIAAAAMERIPANRPAQPDEIANVATFLASAEASYINGENVIVDGGWQTTGYPDLRPFLSKQHR